MAKMAFVLFFIASVAVATAADLISSQLLWIWLLETHETHTDTYTNSYFKTIKISFDV